jgi:hypothetical protein
LSAGPTPRTALADWTFSISGEIAKPKQWTWEEFRKLPSGTITRDIHCVTKWSKFDTVWEGVPVDTLLKGINTTAGYLMAFSDGGYTTNLPLADVMDGKAWVAFAFVVLRSLRNMVAPRDFWCRTSTSGRAPNGCADSASWPEMNLDFGRCTATTCTGTHGGSNATAATDLAPGTTQQASG